MQTRWVFLDRDGTLNVSPLPHEYVTDPAKLRLLPGAGEAVARLNRAGLWVGVVTNQRGIALGKMSEDDLEAVHERLRELLRGHNAHLDGIWFCPHHEGECGCRKPKPGLLLQARREAPEIEFARAVVIGDGASDIAAGRAVGARTIHLGKDREGAEESAADLLSAASLIIDER